jgi:hypothetical protein
MSSVNVTKDCNRKDPAMWAAAAPLPEVNHRVPPSELSKSGP